MTRNPLPRLSLCLLLIVTCASVAGSSSTSRERRHVGVEESSHRPDRIQTTGNRSFKSSTGRQNEITAEPGRKVSHRLIGGHLRVHAKPEADEALWDDGILMSSAGNGKEGKNSARGEDDDEKKTLSQQVKEGKYGLIQNEIYGEQPKRPGIISYLENPEVPKDTIENLGGLDEEEIWLAENHMLVLKGGRFPGHEGAQGSGDGGQSWPPIDDYKAPRRQVKIPPRPKVPPPFPVQLTEGGPVQIIGANGTRENATGTDYKTDSIFSKGLLPGEEPFFAITANGTIVVPDEEASRNLTTPGGKSSSLTDAPKRTKSEPGSLPPFYHAIPPGAVFVAPPSNQSDYEDDDQSIYYPPPYSFFYQQDNTTAVPPGPLVPGIILPPPPDFFSILDDKKATATKKQTKRPSTTPVPRIRPTYLPPRKLSTKLTTKQRASTTVPTVTTRTKDASSSVTKMLGRTSQRNATSVSTSSRQRTMSRVETTTSTPEMPTTIEDTEYYSIGPIIGNQVSETSTQGKPRAWSNLVTGKTLPVVAYYATTTQSSLEKPVEVTPATVKNIITTNDPARTPNQASYYFYEESNDENTRTTTNPSTIYYRTTTESPFYEVRTQPRQKEQKKQYYTIETIPSEQTSKEYNVKLIDSIVKNSQILGYTDSSGTQTSPKYGTSSSRTQSQRMLTDQAPVYYQTISTRPALSVQSYYTSPKPQGYYRQDTKPKPIYQYSFQATDYTKHSGNHRQYYKQRQQDAYSKYQDVKTSRPQYEYQNKDSVPEQQLRPETVSYNSQQPGYTSSTVYPTINTTPNPQHAYFTQQDEKLLDDVTKEYFTIFGKKISGKTLPSTTPLYGKSSSITERPDYDVSAYVQNNYNDGQSAYKTPKVKVHYGDQPQPPYSLKDDTLVNYRKSLPPINPDSEFITVVNHKQSPSPLPAYRVHSEGYRLADRVNPGVTPVRGYTGQQIRHEAGPSSNYAPAIETSGESLESSVESLEAYPQRPLSLEDDIEVNYRDPRPTINPDAEFIDPTSVQDGHSGKPNAYFAYSLPGDGGHFYFLTPQAITQRQEEHDGYLYSKPRGERLLRRRRGPGAV